jgi:hypothetical protein
MKGTRLLLALAGALHLAGPVRASAAERPTVNRRTGLFEIPLSDLRQAAERGDRVELARAAGRLGPARLAEALADPDRRLTLAALEGIPLVPSGVVLLGKVTPFLASADQAIRARAVDTAAALLAETGDGRLLEWEIPPETTRAACHGLAKVAIDGRQPVPTRLAAISGLTDAGWACAGSLSLVPLLSSAAPEIRRAAVLALPPEASADTLLAAARDHDARVAAAAGARLCQRQVKIPAGQRPLHELALAWSAEPEDVVDMVPCLMGSTDLAVQKTVEHLRERGSAAVRDAIKAEAARLLKP